MGHLETKLIMTDITEKIKAAVNQNILWAVSIFFEFIGKLKNRNINISYWEGEENWATLIVEEKPIGYLWKKYPVLIIEAKYTDTLKGILAKNDFLCLITVTNINNEELSLNYDEVNDYFDYGMNYQKFSATDLWFLNNSI